ncbi:MAG: heavy-metal-associated domain-containing protein [Mariprofundaceae bacterium]|nr:heavy-metal-associated domain-containing protein [Mariprofundaceae bacterium]
MYLLRNVFVICLLWLTSLGIVLAGGVASQKASIQVDGLSCPFCTYGLEKNLKKINGIESVDIDIKTGKATVIIKSNIQVDNQALRQAVKKAGFTARDITRD